MDYPRDEAQEDIRRRRPQWLDMSFRSTWATDGPDGAVDCDMERVIKDFHNNKKVIA